MTTGADKSLRVARLFSATYSSPHGAAPPSRHTVRSRPRRRWHPVRLALPRADRGVRRKHQPALWFGRLERGRRRNFYGRRFYRSLEQFDRAASLRCLDVLDHGFKLLVRQAFERIAVLDLVLAGNEQAENLEIARRLLPRDLLNCLLAVLAEMQQQRLHELLIEQVTRAVPVATRVSRNPLLEGHLALHVHRVVLNVNKCLIGLQNTLMQIGLRSEW